jgi:predicted transposase/invertase (TIGR01784 family)
MERRLLSVKNDFIFKKLFGEPGSEDILRYLLEAILKVQIGNLEIQRDRELMTSVVDNKIGIIDVKAVFGDGIKVNVEIQVSNEYNISKRSFFYLSKLYTQDLKKGKDYSELTKVIVINILDFIEFKHDNICHHKFMLKDEHHNESYFEDVCELHFLEMSKIKRDKVEDEHLKDWLRFIKSSNDKEIIMLSEKNNDIYKAVEKLEELSSDEEIRSLAENRAKYLSDYTSSINGAKKKGLERGLKQGLKQGIEKGIEEGKHLQLLSSLKRFMSLCYKGDTDLEVLLSKILDIDSVDKLVEIEDMLYNSKLEEVKNLLLK